MVSRFLMLVVVVFLVGPQAAWAKTERSCDTVRAFDDILSDRLRAFQPTLASLWRLSGPTETEHEEFERRYREHYAKDVHAGLVELIKSYPELKPLADNFIAVADRALAAMRTHIAEGDSTYAATEKAFTDHDPFDTEGSVGSMLTDELDRCRK